VGVSGKAAAYTVQLNKANRKKLEEKLAFLKNEADKVKFEEYKANLIRYGFTEEEAEKQAALRMKKEARDIQKQALAADFDAREKKKLSGKVYDQMRDDFVRRNQEKGSLNNILAQQATEEDIHLKQVRQKKRYIAKHLDKDLVVKGEKELKTEESTDD
jgi:hypothetical protein